MGGAVANCGHARFPELTAAGVTLTVFLRRRRPSPRTSRFRCKRISPTDDWCTSHRVDGFEKGMKARLQSRFFRYDADHGFGNEQRLSVHDRQASELAWGRATAFFKKHLG